MELRYYWDMNKPIKFCSKAYFLGLRVFNEPEISNSIIIANFIKQSRSGAS